jgi:translation initiation factor eIF-2B subunit gamma
MQAPPLRSGSITEFTAVILAGGCGARLYPLTIGCPKALLTIGNRPLLDFQLHHLYCSGFTRVLIVATKNVKEHLNHFINRKSFRTASWWGQQDSSISFHPELHWIDEETDSAFALMSISEHISSDIIVFPCDLVTDVNLQHVADLHRIHGSTLTALVGRPIQPAPLPPGVQRAREPEDRGSIDVIAHDEATKSRLLFLSSAADCETEVAIPRRIMRRHPNVAITSRFLDSHVCVCSDIAFHLRSFFLQLHHVAVGSRFFED